MSPPTMMMKIKTEVKTITINSSLRTRVWFLREPRLSEGSQSLEEELHAPSMSVGEWHLRVSTATSPGSTGEMSSNQQAPERLTDGGQ